MLNGKRPLGSGGERQKRSRSLDVVPSSVSFLFVFLSINTETNRMEVCGCEEQLCAPVRVPQSFHPLLRYWSSYCAETDESGQRSFGQGEAGGQRALHTLRAGSGSLDERDINRNTNKYRHSHKTAPQRSHSKILFSNSCFSFPFIKEFSKLKLFTTIKLSIFLIFFVHLYHIFTKTTLTFDKHLPQMTSKQKSKNNTASSLTFSFLLCFLLFVLKATRMSRSGASICTDSALSGYARNNSLGVSSVVNQEPIGQI